MAKFRLGGDRINPNPCSAEDTERNWQIVEQAFLNVVPGTGGENGIDGIDGLTELINNPATPENPYIPGTDIQVSFTIEGGKITFYVDRDLLLALLGGTETVVGAAKYIKITSANSGGYRLPTGALHPTNFTTDPVELVRNDADGNYYPGNPVPNITYILPDAVVVYPGRWKVGVIVPSSVPNYWILQHVSCVSLPEVTP